MASLKESFSKGITAINVKTNSFMEESKCKTYISTLEKEIQTLKLNIGEIVYARVLAGEEYADAVQELIQMISEKYEEIEQQKKQIEQLAVTERQILGTPQAVPQPMIQQAVEDVKICPNCEAQIAANYRFCNKCGTPLT